jgi:pimeloyl-ACP methyl ester carboxylesterase
VIGLAPVTLAEAIAYAARHPSLNAGLVTVAGTPPDPARLGTYLASLSGIIVNDHQIVAVGGEDAAVPADGVGRWRLASKWSIDLAAKRTSTGEMFDTREDPA